MGYRLQATGYRSEERLAACLPPASSPQPPARGSRFALFALVALALSGCGNIEPWVKPYERQQLADPIMSFDPNPVSSAYMDHVFEAREGARGALGSAGGGCGCN
jgi:Domain of unknown function (DUF4266)